MVHNGIIENYATLKEELIGRGHVFSSETDTEVIAHLVEEAYDGDLLEAVRQATYRLAGAYGIAVVCDAEPGVIVCARKDSPIVVGQGKSGALVASDIVALIDETRVFHFGTLSLTGEPARTTTYRAVEYAKAHGKLVTYDPNLRKPLWNDLNEAKEQMLWGLRQADVVKISDEEVEFLFGLGVQDGAQYILDHYPVKLVFVTCGADGCWFQNRNAGGHVDSLKDIKVVDTTGAGDIFGGSAVWKLLQTGKRPEDLDEAELTQIVSFACRAAGLSTTKHGGISSVPDSIS